MPTAVHAPGRGPSRALRPRGRSRKRGRRLIARCLCHFGVRNVQDWSKMAAKWPQNGARVVPEGSQSGLRAASERPQSGSRAVPERSRSGPRAAPERSRSGPGALPERSQSARKGHGKGAEKAREGRGNGTERAREGRGKGVCLSRGTGACAVGRYLLTPFYYPTTAEPWLVCCRPLTP